MSILSTSLTARDGLERMWQVDLAKELQEMRDRHSNDSVLFERQKRIASRLPSSAAEVNFSCG